MNRDSQAWFAICDLYNLLYLEHTNFEAEYQRFFEKHPVVFSILGVDSAKSFEKSSGYSLPFDKDKGFTPAPDFIGVSKRSGTISIVELKTPFVGRITTSRRDGNRLKLKADAESHVSQATEYVEAIRGSAGARDVIKSAFGVEHISAYTAIIIYGMSVDNDAVLVSRLASARAIRTKIIFYDTLLDSLINFYAGSRKDVFSCPGWVFVFHLIIPERQVHRRSVIYAYGEGAKGALSVVLDDGLLIFECLDSKGVSYSLSSPLSPGCHYIRFEFSTDSSGIYMSLNVDNHEKDLRSGCQKIEFNSDLSCFTLGADRDGKNGAEFYLIDHACRNRTMELTEKITSFYEFKNRADGKFYALEFRAESYMIRGPDGNLIAPEKSAGPILREGFKGVIREAGL